MAFEGDGGTTDLTLRDLETNRSLGTGQRHTFRVRPFQGKILEVEDIHFHHDSAVMMPDSGDIESIADPDDENHVSGLGVLRACYLHAERMPSNLTLIAGHTDRSGSEGYNLTLSQMRADNVFHLLMGHRDEWVDLCNEKHKTEDIQQILIWVTATLGWPCDPGPRDDKMGTKTVKGIKAFQESYNDAFNANLAKDGVVGKKTWGAIFDTYMLGLRLLMVTDDAGLATARARIHFVDDGKKTVGCGENFPVTPDLVANQKSQVDRRVHVLFFDPPEVPHLDCHPGPGTCNKDVCELYGSRRIYRFEPLPKDPTEVARNFRIRLEYGEIDRLFTPIASPASTDPGVRERLQAVGFLYEMVTAGQIANVAPPAFDHFKTVTQCANDAAVAAKLQEMLPDVVLDANTLPAPGDVGKVRIPGTWCVTDLDSGVLGSPATPAGTPHMRYGQEDRIWSDNAKLGLVPIVAVVEQERNGTWGPAPRGIRVHFQLQTPDVPPAGTPPALRATTVTSTKGTSTFVMTGSPKAYVDAEKARNPAVANDPAVDNAHKTVGGKRGHPLAGGDRAKNVLQTGVTHPGFHDHFGFTAARTSPHPNAVLVETNDQGKAAVILMPSRVGGDRYKLRAFLDPIPEPGEDQASDGTEELAVRAETGTIVVWRILRFSKYLRWDYPGPGVDPNDAQHKTNCSGPLNTFDFAGVIATEFSRAWMDVTVEPMAQSPQNITQAQWQSAIRFARGRISTSGLSQQYDMNALLPDSTATAGVNNDNAGLIRYRLESQYNAAKGSGFPNAPSRPVFLTDMARIMHAMKTEVMEFFTRNAISGLTVIQVPTMTSIEADLAFALQSQPSKGSWQRSGWGGFRRGCYVAFGQNTYGSPTFPYDHNRNTMHECGHTLYCPHQYTTTAQVNTGAGVGLTGGVADEHDYHDLCVMGYMPRRPGGDFCGRCMMLFAGWDTHGMPANSPGP